MSVALTHVPKMIAREDALWLKDSIIPPVGHDGSYKLGWPSDPGNPLKAVKVMKMTRTLFWIKKAKGVDGIVTKTYYEQIVEQYDPSVPKDLIVIVDFLSFKEKNGDLGKTSCFVDATGYFKFDDDCKSFEFFEDGNAVDVAQAEEAAAAKRLKADDQ